MCPVLLLQLTFALLFPLLCSVGGAQDAANFRANVEAGQLPLPSDVTYEGLIKDYYFDTSPTSTSEWVDVAG
jgi:hypothetical protein